MVVLLIGGLLLMFKMQVGTVRIPGWKLQFQPPNHIPVEPEPICVYYEPRPLQASPTMSSRSNVTNNKIVERHSMRADVPHSPAQSRPVHETLRVGQFHSYPCSFQSFFDALLCPVVVVLLFFVFLSYSF